MQKTTYLKDYTAPDYLVNEVNLEFLFLDKKVLVTNTVSYYKNNRNATTLILNGTAIIKSLEINGLAHEYIHDENQKELTIKTTLEEFTLKIITELLPWENKSGQGLYAYNDIILTQCEPQGFRKITYYQDRPDVNAIFTVKIIAKEEYQHLLSNGNEIHHHLENGIKTSVWHDPYKKPSYLFALVVGNFAVLQDKFYSKSGKIIDLFIYIENHYLNRVNFAMNSLKKAMQFDEERFGLIYDLNSYRIVATEQFNSGAMENKGLNIFNSVYLVAGKDTATDSDFIAIDAVVAHEYFHNYTGNRVTCRDWFQLSLKEGLTVFREQEFTHHSIDNAMRLLEINLILNNQFIEDKGPLSHSVIPASYQSIRNFYTVTIYEKGAEIIRMYQTLFGVAGFNAGLTLYLKEQDGKAAICEDFCSAMWRANSIFSAEDEKQFMLWYYINGTPMLKVQESAVDDKYILQITQSNSHNTPLFIPLKVAFFAKDSGQSIKPHKIIGKHIMVSDTIILILTKLENTFSFNFQNNVAVIPSLLRDFSAPVELEYHYSSKEREFLINHDDDLYIKYSQLQLLIVNELKDIYDQFNNSLIATLKSEFIVIIKNILHDDALSDYFKSIALKIPSFVQLFEKFTKVNPVILEKTLFFFKKELGKHLQSEILPLYNSLITKEYDFKDYGKRMLKNYLLNYLVYINEDIALKQWQSLDNFTDRLGVLNALNDSSSHLKEQLFNEFYEKYSTDSLVINNWLSLISVSSNTDYHHIIKLMNNKVFDKYNPNKICDVLISFIHNPRLHDNLASYQFICDEILRIDQFNSEVASSILKKLSMVDKLEKPYQDNLLKALHEVKNNNKLSADLQEIFEKILS